MKKFSLKDSFEKAKKGDLKAAGAALGGGAAAGVGVAIVFHVAATVAAPVLILGGAAAGAKFTYDKLKKPKGPQQ